MQDKKIVVFDGVCILCNRLIQFLIKRDKRKNLYFATAQSDFIERNLRATQNKISPMESVVYLRNETVYTESTAILLILADLGGWWKIMSIFRVIPLFIRNAIYRFFAKRRYAIFGKRETCMLPSVEQKSRFILD